MSDDKIKAFPKADALPECPMTVESRLRGFCSHPSIVIDPHERSIRCAKCDASLDAFDYLHQNGLHIQSAWRDFKFVRDRISEMNQSVDRLKREEKRLRALVKRLQDKSSAKLDLRGGL